MKLHKNKSKRSSDRFDLESNDDIEEVISSVSKPVVSNGSSSSSSTSSSRRDAFKDLKNDRNNGSGRVRQNTSETCLVENDEQDNGDDDDGFFIRDTKEKTQEQEEKNDSNCDKEEKTQEQEEKIDSNCDKEEKTQQQQENNDSSNRRPKLPRRSSLKMVTGEHTSESSSRELNKSVGFACPSTNTLHRILSIDDMSSEEKRNMWLQSSCMQDIQQQAVRTVQTIQKFGYDDKFCTRGLERYLSNNAHLRDDYIDSVEEVMCEQEVQGEFGVYCDKSIAEAYKSSGSTSESQIRAEAAAKKDREEVKQNLRLFLENSDVHNEDEAKCLAREYLKKYLANNAACPYKQR